MPPSDRIKEAMETLLKIFQEDNLEKVARAVFRGRDIPADKWSFLNRVLMYLKELFRYKSQVCDFTSF